jgi:ferredoxin
MRVTIHDTCIACSRCYVYYPEVFIRDRNGFAHPKREEVADEWAEMALDAAETCPVGAIDCEE